MSNYTNLVFQTIAGITNAISLNTEQREVEENQNISMPLTTLGTIAALGVLYHLHNNRNFFIDRAVAIRNEIGILTETFAALRANGGANAGDIARAIRVLNEAGILTEENRNALTVNGGANAGEIARAIRSLNEANILTEENRNALTVKGGANAWHIARAILDLNEAGILTEENRNALTVKGGANAWHIAWAIRGLNEAGILTEENFRALTAGGGIRIPKIVSELNAIAQLNQAEFNKIIQQIEEQEWAPCLDAVIGLASINRSMPEKQRLSPEMISEIAAYLAPRGAGLPTYEHRAYELAGELSVHKEK